MNAKDAGIVKKMQASALLILASGAAVAMIIAAFGFTL